MYRHLILSTLALSLVIGITPVTALSQPTSKNQLIPDAISRSVQLAHYHDHHRGYGGGHCGCGCGW